VSTKQPMTPAVDSYLVHVSYCHVKFYLMIYTLGHGTKLVMHQIFWKL